MNFFLDGDPNFIMYVIAYLLGMEVESRYYNIVEFAMWNTPFPVFGDI